MNLLILYPKLFNVSSKFNRKLKRIIADKDVISVTFLNDNNKLIKNYFADLLPDSEFRGVTQINFNTISHAIIFDDGEEFPIERKVLSENSIPHRVINIKITRVVNISRETQFKGEKSTTEYEYIGRGSYWGNPHSMFEQGEDRDEVIRKYKYDFDYEKFPHIEKEEVYKLVGKRLGCFCKPAACHGDVLADYLNSWDDGK